jgi:thiol:disulfide interchange protein
MQTPRRVLLLLAALLAPGAAAGPAVVGGQTGAANESVVSLLIAAVAAGDVGTASSLIMLLVGGVGLACGVWRVMSKAEPGQKKIATAVVAGGGAAVVAVVVAVVVAMTGTLRPPPVRAAATTEIAWVNIAQTDTVATFDAALAAAKAAHQPVMIDFGAASCIACKELDVSTFVDPSVRAEAARFVSIKVDVTDETAALNAIQERFGVVGLPHIAFIGSDGEYLDATTQAPRYEPVMGLLKAAEFLQQLQRVH